ncbi:hypothetical protein A3Q56_07312, partial [Intoshia linei]
MNNVKNSTKICQKIISTKPTIKAPVMSRMQHHTKRIDDFYVRQVTYNNKDVIVGIGNYKYKLLSKIGSGSFGDVYLGENKITHEQVAVKLEHKKNRFPQLLFESKIYRLLYNSNNSNFNGIPRIHWYGTHEAGYNVLVLALLGPNLEDLFNYCSRTFTLKTVLMLADQMIVRLQYVHSRNLIHRDVKPDNFLMGLGDNCSLLYLIDFGLAKKYRDFKTQEHIPYREGRSLTGTARYASINAHMGIEQSRRDDLESLGYILIYLLKGSLPWQGLRAANKKQKYEKIHEKKTTTTTESLTKGCPYEFT